MRGTWRKFAAMKQPLPAETAAAPLANASPSLWLESDTAAYLNVEPRTCRLWRTTRGLPFIRISSKAVRYRKADVDTWLDRRRCQTGKEGAR